jgi:release factor glutamine methyltransferase
VGELIERGLERREARWLVEEFASSGLSSPALESAVARRLSGEPLQYVFGHWPFRSLDLIVDPRALIPRPETEELVDVALHELARVPTVSPLIVDLGCGTGAIGLSLLAELEERGVRATLLCVDVSPDALSLARENARRLELSAVSFVRSSWFDQLDETLRGRIDLIVSNPPYVGALELEELDPVLRYEPRGALVSDDVDGVVGFSDVKMIISQAPSWLSPSGVLVLEHSRDQRTAALVLSENSTFSTFVDLDDVRGNARILVARR